MFGPPSISFEVYKKFREDIWVANCKPALRKAKLLGMMDSMKVTKSDGKVTINYAINGVNVCKDYFKVKAQFILLTYD